MNDSEKAEAPAAVNIQFRLIADCPACGHEQTEPFTEGRPLPVGGPFACWNCGQAMVVTAEAERAAAARALPRGPQ